MSNRRANTSNQIIRDNSIYPLNTYRSGSIVTGDVGYYRRRTTFTGTFTGTYFTGTYTELAVLKARQA